jgi:hypothetical protein
MSYNGFAQYAAEASVSNRRKVDAKPSVGILSGRNWPVTRQMKILFLHSPAHSLMMHMQGAIQAISPEQQLVEGSFYANHS